MLVEVVMIRIETFLKLSYQVSIRENLVSGSEVITLAANDPNGDDKGMRHFITVAVRTTL